MEHFFSFQHQYSVYSYFFPLFQQNMSISKCCYQGFAWDGVPAGRIGKLGNNDAYITGNDSQVAILFISDLFGWSFNNVRLLADHIASETEATVFVPDFFGGEVLDFYLLCEGKLKEAGLDSFILRNSRQIREPEIFDCAKALREHLGYKKVGAVGYCYGGWASFRLGSKEHSAAPLVDSISIGHPSLMTRDDVDNIAVPVQVLAPEVDAAFDREFKRYTFEKLQDLGLPFDYQHFPVVEHACFIRGDENAPGERAAMERAKDAAVTWFRQTLKAE